MKKIFSAVILALAGMAAHAEFIDERTGADRPAKAPAAPATKAVSQTPIPAAAVKNALPAVKEITVTRLFVQPGQRLSSALNGWLKTQGIELSWEASGTLPGRMRDIVFESTWQASDSGLEKTLEEVLQPFSLEALILKSPDSGPRSVVVRNTTISRP